VSIRVGLLAEGHDHFILSAYLVKLLSEEIDADVIDGTGHGHDFVARNIDRALRRFYGKCVQLAIVAIDNDGNRNLHKEGGQEDPRRPRHWLHKEFGSVAGCRWCWIHERVEQTRLALNWIPNKPGAGWPILIVVPVEAIEAWLLTTQAILSPGDGSLHAEQEHRARYKTRFYGRPVATRDDVESKALPMIDRLGEDDLQVLRNHSRSFFDFAEQVERYSDEILTGPPCW
jgi:hypothetical protein